MSFLPAAFKTGKVISRDSCNNIFSSLTKGIKDSRKKMPKGENLIPSSVCSGAQFLKSIENGNVSRQGENKLRGSGDELQAKLWEVTLKFPCIYLHSVGSFYVCVPGCASP